MSKIKKFDNKSIEHHWTEKISKALVGKTITKVRYLSKKEVDDWMWYKTPIAIQLDNKEWLVPTSDDEGNDGGSISTTIKGLPCIPVI